ncbi:MAG: 50S ribosomal protein L22 [Candidatus Hydrothermarchaeales archaeon]
MADMGYSYKPKNEAMSAKAIGKELRISPKDSCEICNAIKGMMIDEAKEYLEDVIDMKKTVPFRRFKKGMAHRRGLKKWYTGRWPRKAASQILEVLKGAEANADYKGLDTDRLHIKHIATKRGRIIKGFIPRAFGRSSPFNTPTSHIEIVLEER